MPIMIFFKPSSGNAETILVHKRTKWKRLLVRRKTRAPVLQSTFEKMMNKIKFWTQQNKMSHDKKRSTKINRILLNLIVSSPIESYNKHFKTLFNFFASTPRDRTRRKNNSTKVGRQFQKFPIDSEIPKKAPNSAEQSA